MAVKESLPGQGKTARNKRHHRAQQKKCLQKIKDNREKGQKAALTPSTFTARSADYMDQLADLWHPGPQQWIQAI